MNRVHFGITSWDNQFIENSSFSDTSLKPLLSLPNFLFSQKFRMAQVLALHLEQ